MMDFYRWLFLPTETGRLAQQAESGSLVHALLYTPNRSISLSPDGRYLAIGQFEGKIIVRNLGGILPDLYGPFQVSNREEASASNDHDIREIEILNKDSNSDLLEFTVPTSTPVTLFDYNEPPSSASSTQTHEDTAPTARPSDTKSQPSDRPPLPDTQPEKIPDAASPSQDVPSLKRWLQTRFKKGSTLQEPDRHFRKSSTMASGQRQKRTVTKSPSKRKPNSPVKATAHKDTTHNEKVPGKSKQVGSACLRLGIVDHVVMAHIYVQRANDTSRRSEKVIQLTHRPDTGRATLSISFPGWMLCFRSRVPVEDGTH
ncbi:hypothetical protein V8E55_005049 [Tylopilus felleus]